MFNIIYVCIYTSIYTIDALGVNEKQVQTLQDVQTLRKEIKKEEEDAAFHLR